MYIPGQDNSYLVSFINKNFDKHMNKNTAIILVTILLSVNCSMFSQSGKNIPDYTPLIEKYRKILIDEIEKNNVAGLSIALVDGDSTVWCEGFGYYNKEEKKAVTGHTPFHIGSICKAFTGLAVMQLEENNKLNINDPFGKYVPEFKIKTRFGSLDKITIRSILTHHAGIPDYIKDKFAVIPPYFTGVLDLVNNDYAVFPPNTIFSYSNTGFSILGNLIESVSGTNYFDFMQTNILTPLEMNETGFVKDNKVPESVLLGYNMKGEEQHELAVFDSPAGCIFSTAYDMAKYIKAHLNWGKYKNKTVFDSTTLDKMMQIQNSDVFLDLGSPYGLAWRIYFNDAGKSIQHDGGTLYHRAELSISPECGLGVIMMSNSASGKPLYHADYDILNEALKIKGVKPKTPAAKSVKNILHPEHNFVFRESEINQIKYVNKSIDELTKYSGKYGTFGMYLTITPDSNSLFVDIRGQKFYLLPLENDEFIPAGKNDRNTINPTNRFYFEKVNDNLILLQVDQWGNHNILAEKIEMQPLTNVWQERLGGYNTDGINNYQMFSDFKLTSSEGLLLLSAKFNMEFGSDTDVIIPLKIINDNLAIVWGYGRFSGQAVQFVKNNNSETMRFMGFNCKLINKSE